MSLLDSLKAQLAHSKQEFEQAKAYVIRCDGAIQVLEHLIKEAEAEAVNIADTVKDEALHVVDEVKKEL